jgi:outer membrane protein assembly factor BamD
MFYKNVLAALLVLLFAAGCASKNEDVYNKPARYWYDGIIKEIRGGDLEKADDYYASLSSEHISSPLLKESMLILAEAHMEEEEYLLANFYLDEFIKRFGDKENSEFARFLKVKANFAAFKYPNRDQQLLLDTIKNAKSFLQRYPNSKFSPFVQTILAKLYMAEYKLNKEIASLYHRTDKEKAAKIYEEKLKNSWVNNVQIVDPKTSWYRSIFEW